MSFWVIVGFILFWVGFVYAAYKLDNEWGAWLSRFFCERVWPYDPDKWVWTDGEMRRLRKIKQ